MTGIICYCFMQILCPSNSILCAEHKEIFYLFLFLNIKSFTYSVGPNQDMSWFKELRAFMPSRHAGIALQDILLLSGPARVLNNSAKFSH